MDNTYPEIDEYLSKWREDIDLRKAQLADEQEQVKAIEALLTHATKAEEQLDLVRQERDSLKQEVAALKMNLQEQQKITAKVAEKTEHEDLIKVLRSYINQSKKKTAKKRGYIKMVITEMAMSNSMILPADMIEALESFDDETEKTINIERVNDIHNNDRVEIQP